MELACGVQNYHWGKKGRESLVAQLKCSADPSFEINEAVRYAELWMGTHPNAPSYVKHAQKTLESVIKEHTNKKDCNGTVEGKLPFLFKVLSVDVPLSVQVHPSKEQALSLHKLKPSIYQDDNHKPEMIIALSDFEALCSFRPINEIRYFLRVIPELQAIIGQSAVDELISCSEALVSEKLKIAFSKLMNAPSNIKAETVTGLATRLLSESTAVRKDLLADLFERLHQHFPGDIGCICIYFFNYVVLEPGQSLFVNTGEPHAYINGDCIECMANSDNVVRAGLTPKLIDTDTLCEILSYSCENPADLILLPFEYSDPITLVYRPPVEDFAVSFTTIDPGASYTFPLKSTASIFIVMCGRGTYGDIQIRRGQVFFQWALNTDIIRACSEEKIVIFQAFTNIL